jgi:hypothetical protein
MGKNKSIAWNVFVSTFFVLLIATFVFYIYEFIGDISYRRLAASSIDGLFFISLTVLFSVFVVLFISFISLWFHSNWKDCVLIVSKELSDSAWKSFVSIVTGLALLIIIILFVMGVMKTEEFSILRSEKIIRNSIIVVCGILYSVVLVGLLFRLFKFKNLLLKEHSGEAGDAVKKSVLLLPYMFIIFLLFEHIYLFGLFFLETIEWASGLVLFFQVLAFIWISYAWGITKFIYTQEEYDNMLTYGAGKVTGLGAGLGAYQTSFFKTWIWGGALYWGVPVFIYLFVVIIIVAMFLPLTRIIQYLG